MTIAHALYKRVRVLIGRKYLQQFFRNIISHSEENGTEKVVKMHTGNATEFILLRRGLKMLGVILKISPGYSFQFERRAEHINSTFPDKVLGILQ